GVELGLDLVAGTAGAGHAAAAGFGVGAAALDHEALDDAVKSGAVVETLGSELLEILHVAGGHVGPELEGEVALGGGDDCELLGVAHGKRGQRRPGLPASQARTGNGPRARNRFR